MHFNIYFSRKNYLLCFLLLLFVALSVYAGETELSDTKTAETEPLTYLRHPHCGLYCLYSVLKLEEQVINFKDLVKPEYLSSQKGSSIEQLTRASNDFGMNSKAVSRLEPKDLRMITTPAILHIKSSPESEDYDHFVLYLGERKGKAMIMYPPEELKLLEYSSLKPKWDGNALLISSHPLDLSMLISLSMKRLIIPVTIIAFLVMMINIIKKRVQIVESLRLKIGYSIGQATSLALISLFLGLLCHFFYDGGFFANSSDIKGIQKAHAGNFLPKVNEKQVEQLLGTNTVFIDARLARDYEADHLEGAISIPVNSTDEERHKATSNIDKNANIVMYCQSAGCKFAEKVTEKLKDDGFTNISIYKGGWADWKAKNSEKKETTL